MRILKLFFILVLLMIIGGLISSCATSKFVVLPRKDRVLKTFTGYVFEYDNKLYFIPSEDTSYSNDIFMQLECIYLLDLEIMTENISSLFCVQHFTILGNQGIDTINSSYIRLLATVDSVSYQPMAREFNNPKNDHIGNIIYGKAFSMEYFLSSDKYNCSKTKK